MIKKSPQYDLRELFYSVLHNAVTYAGAYVPVYEAVPKGQAFPYIVIEDCLWTNEDTKDAWEEDYVLRLGIYTGYGGTLDNCAILDSVYQTISTIYQAGNLQFIQTPTRSDFCLTMFWFGSGETRVMRPEETGLEEELERTSLELMCRVKQLR
jgi:hypothetical protein